MSRRASPDAARRGWCPGLARPMPTGDGLLARIHPPLGVLALAQAQAVAEGARRYGNGHLDLTARANLQIRGVSEATTAPLSALLTAAGLGDTRTDGGPQRLTLTGPLADDTLRTLTRAIEAAGRSISGLPAKTLVAVGFALDEADVSVVPVAEGLVAIGLATAAEAVGVYPLPDAPAVVALILTAFAATGRRRMRDLTADELRAILPPRHCEQSEAIQGSGSSPNGALLIGFAPLAMTAIGPAPGFSSIGGIAILTLDAPFGRCTADAFARLIAVAEDIGAAEFRLTPSRGLVLVPTRLGRAEAHLPALAEDFITGAGDPRRAVAACTGAPACASGTTQTLVDAARLAEAFRPLATRGLSAHVSGCAKGCAKPGPADMTLVGRDGEYAIIIGGAPGDPPSLQLPIETALERLGKAATIGLAAAFRPEAIDGGRNRRPA
ncbi:precorrin-3B synthase [Methylobacterium persicinum]|uniref:Precorrin-3B synthase n=1 Tax=Methylobacterium persicinum TaxID=374426 RepID=A0ABU0HGR1_9HYPH|nr:precorrin-3B synthase [Methylobacterium persicinum]MDQ0441498.1 precorrin-3B synthase [Methylobacterium persicinum]GJE39262.1 Sulfite reductase [ferredoxin] [Methylobacterium persicinum]